MRSESTESPKPSNRSSLTSMEKPPSMDDAAILKSGTAQSGVGGPLRQSTLSSSHPTGPTYVPTNACTALEQKGLEADQQGFVRWKKQTSRHPRRWPLHRKNFNSAVICFMEFFMTLVSNAGSTIVPVALGELGVGKELALFCFTTLYLLGQALGGLILPPFAESFGAQMIYTTSTLGFCISCVIIAACHQSLAVISIFRFVSGFLSAMPATVAVGSIENMWDIKARVWLVHLWISSAVFGLSLSPVITTVISESSLGWHWFFYIAAIVTGALAALCSLMQESRPSQLLRQHLRGVKQDPNFEGLAVTQADAKPDARTFIQVNLTLPVRMFFTEPIVFLASIMGATVYGVIYLFTAVLPDVYAKGYDFSSLQSSLIFLAIGVGVPFTFLPRLYDTRVLRRKDDQVIEPEDKLCGIYIAAPVLAIGLWWFAWTVPPLVHGVSPWVSIVSLLFFGYSVVEFDNILSGYLCDAYTEHSASATSPMCFLRAVLSGVFPLFGEQMFHNLGTNIAMLILASIATGFCIITALFGIYGKRIRKLSPLAHKTAIICQDTDADSGDEALGKGERSPARKPMGRHDMT